MRLVDFIIDRVLSVSDIHDSCIYVSGENSISLTRSQLVTIKRQMFSLPPMKYEIIEHVLNALEWDSELKRYIDDSRICGIIYLDK